MKVQAYKFYAISISIIAYVAWFISYDYFKSANNVSSIHIGIMSWIGIALFVGYMLVWKKLTGRFLTLFSLFLCFFTVFNFGQSFLWAFGIHTTLRNEIGNAPLYGIVSYDSNLIVQAQLMYIICFITLNLGAILVWRPEDKNKFTRVAFDWDSVDDVKCKNLYIASSIILTIAYPATMYIAIRNFVLGQLYSYHDLYYGNLGAISSIISILDGLFFPALIGVLIGSKYDKRKRFFVYGLFLIYAVVTLLCGDRGEWINKLVVLFWADTWFNKPLSKKKITSLILIILLGSYVIAPFVELRNVGLSVEGIKKVYTTLSMNPIISMLVEFGHSMGIAMVVIKNNVKFPYGNSYLMSFVTILSTRWANILFGIEYTQVPTWFSRDYLGILYGADFSMIGEAILNYNVYFAPIIIAILGGIISKISQLPLSKNMTPLSACLAIAAMEPILKMSRSSFWYALSRCAFFIIIFVAVYSVVESITKRRQPNHRYV